MANSQVKPLYLKNDEYIDGNGEPATKAEIRAWEDHLDTIADQQGQADTNSSLAAEVQALRDQVTASSADNQKLRDDLIAEVKGNAQAEADRRNAEAAAMNAEMEKLRKALAEAEKKAADKASDNKASDNKASADKAPK